MKTFIKILKPHTVNLVKDLNGNHIILKVLNVFEISYCFPLYETLNSNLMEISLHKHGCCVLQKCIDSASQDVKQFIIETIIHNIPELIVDQYGNYIVQYVMTLGDPKLVASVVEGFLKELIFLSKQKYSSNVVEKVK
jgi:pumilio RNA-binding family